MVFLHEHSRSEIAKASRLANPAVVDFDVPGDCLFGVATRREATSPMENQGSSRNGDIGMGRLVQPPPTTRTHLKYTKNTMRGKLLQPTHQSDRNCGLT